jgi:hypothetical protein
MLTKEFTYTSPYYKRYSEKDCGYLYSDRLRSVELVAQSIYHDFPKARNRFVWLGDACPLEGNCPKHPGISHGRLKSLDILYYLVEDTTRDNLDSKLKGMWGVQGEVLNKGKFDAERNFVFLYRLNQILPNSVTRANQILYNEMEEVAKDYGSNINSIHPTPSVGTYANHHVHCHIDLGEFNKDFRINNFIKVK